MGRAQPSPPYGLDHDLPAVASPNRLLAASGASEGWGAGSGRLLVRSSTGEGWHCASWLGRGGVGAACPGIGRKMQRRECGLRDRPGRSRGGAPRRSREGALGTPPPRRSVADAVVRLAGGAPGEGAAGEEAVRPAGGATD